MPLQNTGKKVVVGSRSKQERIDDAVMNVSHMSTEASVHESH